MCALCMFLTFDHLFLVIDYSYIKKNKTKKNKKKRINLEIDEERQNLTSIFVIAHFFNCIAIYVF